MSRRSKKRRAHSSANNAGAQGAFIPMLTMGIPCNVTLAILMGALMILVGAGFVWIAVSRFLHRGIPS